MLGKRDRPYVNEEHAFPGPPGLRDLVFPSEVALGEEILVGCFVKKGTVGPYRITWLKDGREIQESERVSIAARSKTSAALRISSLRAEDVGNYTCAASNDFGTDTVTAALIINDIPKIQEFNFPASLSPGDTAHVGCIVSKGSAGPLELSWKKDDLPLAHHSSSRLSVMSHKGGPVSTLTIVDVSAADSGNYTCMARNAAGNDSFSAFLAVTGAPRLQSSGFPNELSLGEETVATCFVKKGSVGPYTLTWHKEGKPVYNSDRVVVTVKATSTALSIDSVQVEDIGNYTCSATSAAGTDVLTLPLLISAPPSIRRFSFPPEIALGEEVIVLCSVKKGSPADSYSIAWQKDGREVVETERVSTSSQTKGSATLLIASLEPEDVGNYTCTARNAFGSDSFTAPLVVNGPPRLLEFAFPAEVGLGDEIIVPCVVRKATAGPYRITWQKDGVSLEGSGRRVSVSSTSSKSSSTLRIAGLQPEDVGNYTCAASNAFGSDSFTASLVVHDAPKINEFKFPANLSPGDTVAVICVIKKGSAGPFELSWQKDGRPLEPTASLAVTSQKGGPVSTLTIVDVSARDSGNYTCVARNSAGSDRYSAHLAVTASPKLREFAFPPESTLGEQILVSCAVRNAATGPHRMTWLKDGKALEKSDRVSVSAQFKGTAAIMIADLRPEDVGNYTCVASNAFGSDSFTAALVVQGPPKIREFKFPADISPGETALVGCVIAKGSAGPFELSWLKDGRPLSSSGSPRTAVSPNKGGPASTLTIVDVSAQDSGNYTCVARNAAGSDSFSAFLAVTGPPRLLEFSFPAEVGLGDEIIVSCVVRKGTAGPYTLSWHKDGTALKDSGRVSASSAHSKSSVTLRIAGLQPEDVGNYTCAASNPFGSDSFTAPLVVNGRVSFKSI
ncbi:hemicentin-1 [Dermacentor silvarum]|uniref:hemicentin-1 n=1 Tax=Dermacentor silvarum TaxID=543639 RepID=UPI0021010C38|nr:hemicentin-1 [Dermacentor silvarum]